MRNFTLSVSFVFGLTTAVVAAENHLTHGPILGRLAEHHVGVWARTSKPGVFRVRYGQNRGELDGVSPPAATHLSADNTGWVLVEGLQSGTRYDYEVVVDGADSGPGGSFRTLPSPDDYRDPQCNPRGLFNFSFEFGCGNQQRRRSRAKQRVAVFETILQTHGDQLHFAIQNGDWSYEDFRDYSPEAWQAQLGITARQTPELVRIVPPVVGAWENCKVYLARSDELARWHRNMPVFFTFDDHEIVDDAAGAGTIGARPRRALFRDIGLRAWYDYVGWSNPVESQQDIHFGVAALSADSNILTDLEADFAKLNLAEAAELHVHWGGLDSGLPDKRLDTIGGNPNAGVYRMVRVIDEHRLEIDPPARHNGRASYSIGRLSYFKKRVANCLLLFVDTRSHRQLPDNDNPKKEGISLLGRRQKQWLKDTMAASQADCFFIISSVNFMIPHIVDVGEATFVNYDDSWTTFWHEREELIRFFEGLDKKVFILTGDLHNSFVVKVSENIWEFASAPHSSGNARMTSEGNRPPNGLFDSHGRKCFIRWSTWYDNPYAGRNFPSKVYCVVKVNNVFHNPQSAEKDRWQAYPHPQILFCYYDGLSGKLLYPESVVLD